MHVHPLWNDQYWPLIIKLYLAKPMGMKAMYSKGVVDLSIELHIPPFYIYERLEEVERNQRPLLQHLRTLYEGNARRLSRDVKQLRQMAGFGTGGLFFDDVCIDNDFERDYCPVADDTAMTPAMLTLILNLYFQLIPDTMKATTPEVQLLAKRLHVTSDEVVQVLKLCLAEDPCIPEHRRERLLGSSCAAASSVSSASVASPATSSAAGSTASLSQAVNKLWHRYGNGDAIMVEEAAERFNPYFE